MHSISEQLRLKGFSISPNFFGKAAMNALRSDFSRIENEQGFSQAGTGQGSEHSVRNGTRRDSVHWLKRGQGFAAQDQLWRKIDSLQLALNRNLFLNLHHFEGHYARYPQGGFYRRHLDCFRRDDARQISFALYLNKDWQSAHGGRLRIHGPFGEYTDIDPIGGTLVCFVSSETEHEVMESFAPRSSFTGWFKLAPAALDFSFG
jgi:SM-20-related protein